MLVCLIIIIILIACFIAALISDWIVDKEIERKKKERATVETRLTTSLKVLCAQLGIDLSYHKELGDAAGRILYRSCAGRLLVDDAKIEILERLENEPYTLAHELGHYMAIKQRQDNSEQGADIEADKLCRLILNKKEQEVISVGLRCYFQHKN